MDHEPSTLWVPPTSVQPSGTWDTVTLTRLPCVGSASSPRLMGSPAIPAGWVVVIVALPSTAPSVGFEIVTVTDLLLPLELDNCTLNVSLLSLGLKESAPEVGVLFF